MKKIYSYLGGIALILFSFYFTDKVSNIILNKNTIVKNIKEVMSEYETKPVDAKINKNSITPGIYGKKVDVEKSYMNMQDFGAFNSNYLDYNYVKPNKSLEDNKDKFIISGNKQKRQVSIILTPNTNLENEFQAHNIKYNLIANIHTTINKNKEYFIGEKDENNFKLLSRKITPPNLCLSEYSNINLCKKNKYFLIKPNITLTDYNIDLSLSDIEAGSIILITSLNTENVGKLLNRIRYKGLEVVYVSKLIDEKA